MFMKWVKKQLAFDHSRRKRNSYNNGGRSSIMIGTTPTSLANEELDFSRLLLVT